MTSKRKVQYIGKCAKKMCCIKEIYNTVCIIYTKMCRSVHANGLMHNDTCMEICNICKEICNACREMCIMYRYVYYVRKCDHTYQHIEGNVFSQGR